MLKTVVLFCNPGIVTILCAVKEPFLKYKLAEGVLAKFEQISYKTVDPKDLKTPKGLGIEEETFLFIEVRQQFAFRINLPLFDGRTVEKKGTLILTENLPISAKT